MTSAKENPTRWGVVIETPAYDLIIFKVHYGKMTLKIYTKGERVLRIEVIVHNTKEYRWGRSLPCFPEIMLAFGTFWNDSSMRWVAWMRASSADETLEQLPQPAEVGRTKVGGIDLNQTRMRHVAEAVLALSTSPAGFTASELAREGPCPEWRPESEYGARRAAYDIKKLRGKGMMQKIGKSRRYEPLPARSAALTALLVLREKVIRPLLAATKRPEPQSKLMNPTTIDHYYEALRTDMQNLFHALGVAA